jgi:hypothetical protein
MASKRRVTFDDSLPLLASDRSRYSDDGLNRDVDEQEEIVKHCCFSLRRRIWNEVIIIVLMLLVVALGSANTVASQIMTTPMNNYSFFLSVFNPILYACLIQTRVFQFFRPSYLPYG